MEPNGHWQDHTEIHRDLERVRAKQRKTSDLLTAIEIRLGRIEERWEASIDKIKYGLIAGGVYVATHPAQNLGELIGGILQRLGKMP